MTIYIHSAADRMLYEVPDGPSVTENRDRRGKRTGWTVEMRILITRPDNQLVGSQWKFATMDPMRHHYPPHYSRTQATDFFCLRHKPRGDVVAFEQFALLKDEYENAASGQAET